MILHSLLPKIIAHAAAATTALDVGGWQTPLNCTTHCIDLFPFDTRGKPLDPQSPVRSSPDRWVVHDINAAPWPFPDKFFDFAFCSHTLEDIRDPIVVVRELSRVAKSGYIEVPSRVREFFVKTSVPEMKRLIGRPCPVGFDHHRWYTRYQDGQFTFFAKPGFLPESWRFHIRRSDIGRRLTEAESGLAVFWRDKIDATESSPSDLRVDAMDFRRRAISALRANRITLDDFSPTATLYDPDTLLGLWSS